VETPAKSKRGEKVDVLIIGAGPSGSVAAKHLAMAGFFVVTLEQGNWPDSNNFPGRKPEFELPVKNSGIPIPMCVTCHATIRWTPVTATLTH
jgi:choline dehydrogenase-like flavoprotein